MRTLAVKDETYAKLEELRLFLLKEKGKFVKTKDELINILLDEVMEKWKLKEEG